MHTRHRPPPPVTENWEWQLCAACRGMDVEIFYHPPGERRHDRDDRVDRAKRICHQCPVIGECADHALKTMEPCGVWGGLSEDDRAIVLGLPSRRASFRHPLHPKHSETLVALDGIDSRS